MNRYEKRFPIGSVVYHFKKYGCEWNIVWGLVYEHYHDCLVVEKYTTMETRLIDGIPYNDWKPDTRRKKLPKGWTYDTRLFELSYLQNSDILRKAKNLSVRNPDDILTAIEIGYFVKCSEKDWSCVKDDITKDGYILFKGYDKRRDYTPDSVQVQYHECFTTYEEAEEVRKQHDDEILRQCNLTDYEWSLEQIDNTLNKAVGISVLTEKEAESIRKQLLQKDIENIDVRLDVSGIQWKLCKNRKWINIEG